MLNTIKNNQLIKPFKPIVHLSRLIRNALLYKLQYKNNLDYWEKRVEELGDFSVINQAHTREETEAVTQMQIEAIFPVIKKYLNGSERTVLDFGCGPGRFTEKLATLINGKAFGVDPIKKLLPKEPTGNVEFRLLHNETIPLDDESIDIVFCCHVLGGIELGKLKKVRQEINRVLKTGGLIFLIENTGDDNIRNFFPSHWFSRTVSYYEKLFAENYLKYEHFYYDCGEKESIFSGIKK